LFLTAGVDVQKDRLECEVVAWGRGKESWSVDYIIIDGDTARPETWKRLDSEILQKDWPHASGHSIPIRVMAVDSGYATQDVYAFVRDHPQAVWGGSGARANDAPFSRQLLEILLTILREVTTSRWKGNTISLRFLRWPLQFQPAIKLHLGNWPRYVPNAQSSTFTASIRF
jgi:hypothetical protein